MPEDDNWMVRLLQEDMKEMDAWPEWRKQEARTRYQRDTESAEQRAMATVAVKTSSQTETDTARK